MRMEPGTDGVTRWVMGRLKSATPERGLCGHAVRARAGGRILDSSVTTRAGRFLMTWTARNDERTSVELLDTDGDIIEVTEIAGTELLSPPVVVFSPARMPHSIPKSGESESAALLADGDNPVCIASSCAHVTLSWSVPKGTKALILSGDTVVRKGLDVGGSLKVLEEGVRRYTMRAEGGEFKDCVVEVRRCPTLALVMQGVRFRRGTPVEFGVSTSCPAGPGGLRVRLLTSDQEVIPGDEFVIQAGSTWGSARVNTGRKPGKVEVTASAPGYSRDGVSFFVV